MIKIMSKNKPNLKYEAIFTAWLLLNGMATGHLIGDMRAILAHGYRFDDAMGIDVTLTLIAMIISAQRALYWHHNKNNHQK